MQPRTTAILFVVAVLLGAFVYLYELEGEAGRKRAEDAGRRIFPGVEAEAIDRLGFRTQSGLPFASVREGDGWQIRTPVAFPGDAVNLDAIASALASLSSEAVIDSPGAAEIYGLGKLAQRVQFRVAEQSYELEIGAETPVGGNVYVARADDPGNVFSVPSFRVSSFDRDLASLRDRRVVSFDRTQVESVVVGWPGGGIRVEKTHTGWAIREPSAIAGEADAKAIDDLLSDLAFLRAEGFVDGEPGAAQVEIAEAYFSLRLGLAASEGQAREVEIRVVREPDGEDYLVRGGHPDALYRVPRARIVEFPRDLFAYRFKLLADFEVARVDSFELVFATPAEASSAEPVALRVNRVDAGWQAVGEAWAPGAAAGLIAEFAHLEAVSVAAESADRGALESFGLAPAQVVLRAFAAPAEGDAAAVPGSRELLAEVSLGNLDADAGVFASARGQQTVYRVAASLAEQIPIGLDAFRARFLAPPETR